MSETDIIPADFAQGVVGYFDSDPSQPHSRIMIPASFGNLAKSLTVLDTGSPSCILNPVYADQLDVDYRAIGEPYGNYMVRGVRYDGWLCSGIALSIEADRGADLEAPATVFIPELDPSQRWGLPNFIGLTGFLERIRFAVDPFRNLFYFGTESQDS